MPLCEPVLTQNFKSGSNVLFYITVGSVKSHSVKCLSKGQQYETAMFCQNHIATTTANI